MLFWGKCRPAVAAFTALTATFGAGDFAAAQTAEQAQATCREKMRPAVQSCVRQQVQSKGGQPQSYVEGCRQQQTGAFRSCVSDLMAADVKRRPQVPAPAAKEEPIDLSKVKLARTAGFVAPPRTIADITAILAQEKPDPARTAKMRQEADAQPTGGDRGAFYFTRCQARANLGRSREAIADCEKAISFGGDYMRDVSRYEQLLSLQYRQLGDYRKVIELERAMVQKLAAQERSRGRLFGVNLRIAMAYALLGERQQADVYVRRNQALLEESARWQNVQMYRSGWTATVENGNARMHEVYGRYAEAEASYVRAQTLLRDAIAQSASWPIQPTPGSLEATLDYMVAFEAQMKLRQGRLGDAEATIRRALLSRLKAVGKYHPDTAYFATIFARLLVEASRFAEAEQIARTAVEIYGALGYPEDLPVHAFALNQLASTLQAQRRFEEAAGIYARLDVATKDWPAARRDAVRLNWSRIFTAYLTDNVAAGVELARAAVAKQRELVGEKHQDFAIAQAVLGAGLVYARRDAEALSLFKASMPVLMAATREVDTDDSIEVAAHDRRMASIVETYLMLLARAPDPDGTHAAESFRLGEMVRGQSVQKALAASSARAAAADPALADLVRQEQDLEKQIAAALGSINNQLALPSEERDDKELQHMQSDVAKLRRARVALRRDIERRFPNYAELVAARPPTVDDVRTALKPDEAYISFYFGRRAAFAWAVPKQGRIAFAMVRGAATSFEDTIKTLREALDPQAASISDIPPFDVKLAYELYAQLLKPIEAGWKPAKDLIVATNGALGLLPLGLLPTEPTAAADDGELKFSGYRKVAWLARSHAVTMVPSAAALRMLRHLPPSPPTREVMIGFGDPYFSEQQASRAAEPEPIKLASAGATTRGVPLQRRNAPQTLGVDSAELGLLPRLPDTADELRSIAAALQADPSKVLHLGKQANEKNVKSLDLSKYRIVVFATHGLVPGELNGLHQPALAMTAPDVAQHEGDGLLTMEEILALKLDADWVVLSACNTGAGAGAGAEAASGLGRAFFYAGTRAILVTNWSVHSVSARELVTELFRRQAGDAKLSRGQALREAVIELLDKGGYADERGKPVFAYAHPLFWAPYTIIGDGGAL